jgi:hypothetical protein
MYCLINENVGKILANISSKDITEYDWLQKNIGAVNESDYRRRYRAFWAMNAAQLSPNFYTSYFGALQEAPGQSP